MRRLSLVELVLAISLAVPIAFALAQTEPAAAPTTTTLAPRPDAPETTEVLGTVPAEFAGRWLFVGSIKMPSGQVRPVPRVFEIRKGAEHLELLVNLHPMPDAVNKKVDAATQAGTLWKPDAEDLRAIGENWETQPEIQVAYTKVEHKLIAAEAYAPEFKEDETTKDAKYAITVHELFAARSGATRAYTVFGVRDMTADTMSGSYLTSTIAAAPMPIPIVLKGDFIAYRVGGTGAAAPKGSWLDRLFAGCHG
jgi:hypothetical protein